MKAEIYVPPPPEPMIQLILTKKEAETLCDLSDSCRAYPQVELKTLVSTHRGLNYDVVLSVLGNLQASLRPALRKIP